MPAEGIQSFTFPAQNMRGVDTDTPCAARDQFEILLRRYRRRGIKNSLHRSGARKTERQRKIAQLDKSAFTKIERLIGFRRSPQISEIVFAISSQLGRSRSSEGLRLSYIRKDDCIGLEVVSVH